ncbi:MAG: hypothetical protein ACT4PP_01525 [Sporichthyaceae bacterium]
MSVTVRLVLRHVYSQIEAGASTVTQTRLKDRDLLIAALQGLDAEIATVDGVVSGVWEDVAFAFVYAEDGTLAANFPQDLALDRAREFVLAVDAQYARAVQTLVAERVRERAAALGMTLESDTVGPNRELLLVLDTDGGR